MVVMERQKTMMVKSKWQKVVLLADFKRIQKIGTIAEDR